MQLTIRDLSKTYPNGTRALKYVFDLSGVLRIGDGGAAVGSSADNPRPSPRFFRSGDIMRQVALSAPGRSTCDR